MSPAVSPAQSSAVMIRGSRSSGNSRSGSSSTRNVTPRARCSVCSAFSAAFMPLMPIRESVRNIQPYCGRTLPSSLTASSKPVTR